MQDLVHDFMTAFSLEKVAHRVIFSNFIDNEEFLTNYKEKCMSITIEAIYDCTNVQGELLVAPLKWLNGHVVKTLDETPPHLAARVYGMNDLIGLLFLYAVFVPVACVGMAIKFPAARKIIEHNQQQERNLLPAYMACRKASSMTPAFEESYGHEEIQKLAKKERVASFSINPINVEQTQWHVNQEISEFSRKGQKIYFFCDLALNRGEGGGSIDLYIESRQNKMTIIGKIFRAQDLMGDALVHPFRSFHEFCINKREESNSMLQRLVWHVAQIVGGVVLNPVLGALAAAGMVTKAIDARNVKKHNKDQKKQLKAVYADIQREFVTGGFSDGGKRRTGVPKGWETRAICDISIGRATDLFELKRKIKRKIKKANENFQRIYIEFGYNRHLAKRNGFVNIQVKERA